MEAVSISTDLDKLEKFSIPNSGSEKMRGAVVF